MSPGRAGVRRECPTAARRLQAAGKVTHLPRAALERTGDENDHADGDRDSTRHRGPLHLHFRERDAAGKAIIPNIVQTKK
jgi:hypothetical protein